MSALSLRHADRVRDTASSVSGTTVTLSNSAPTGFQTFGTAYANADVVPAYLITDGTNWEISYGAYTSSGTTLARASTPIASSNAGAQVSAFSGTITVETVEPAAMLNRKLMGLPLTSRVYSNAKGGTATATSTSNAIGTTYYMPVYINQWFTSCKLHVNINALASGSATMALGLYDNADGPHTRLVQQTGMICGNQGGGATGDNATATLTMPSPQPPGLYWVGWVCATTVPTMVTYSPAAAANIQACKDILGLVDTTTYATTHLKGSEVSATLPTTAANPTTVAAASELVVVVEVIQALPGRFYDRVQDTASAVSGSTVTLSNSAPAGCQTFGSVFANADPVPAYLISDGTNWEVSYGVYTASGTTIARASTPIASSNSGSQVSAFSGTVTVCLVEPATMANEAQPGIVSGRGYSNYHGGTTTTTVSRNTGTVRYMPVWINQWFSSAVVHFNISALAAATSTMAFGLYNNANGGPGTRLGQTTGIVSGNQGGGATGDNASATLTMPSPQPPGLYWAAHVITTTAVTMVDHAESAAGAVMGIKEITGLSGSTFTGDFNTATWMLTQSNATLPTTASTSPTFVANGDVCVVNVTL